MAYIKNFGDFLLSCSFVFNRPFLKYLKEAFFTLYSLFRDHLPSSKKLLATEALTMILNIFSCVL